MRFPISAANENLLIFCCGWKLSPRTPPIQCWVFDRGMSSGAGLFPLASLSREALPYSILSLGGAGGATTRQRHATCSARGGAGFLPSTVAGFMFVGVPQWTDAQTDGRTVGRSDGRTDGRTDARTNGRTDGRTDALTDGRPDGPTDRRADSTTN
jgi:hypothetical protein